MMKKESGAFWKKEVKPIEWKEPKPHKLDRLDEEEIARAIHDLILRDHISKEKEDKSEER